jgi:hypothetical protein
MSQCVVFSGKTPGKIAFPAVSFGGGPAGEGQLPFLLLSEKSPKFHRIRKNYREKLLKEYSPPLFKAAFFVI